MKTETKHTAGPWTMAKQQNNLLGIYGGKVGHLHIAEVSGIDGQGSANAALIARAPDLLAENERLKTVLRRIIAMHDDAMFISGIDDSAIVEKNLTEARAALNPLKP